VRSEAVGLDAEQNVRLAPEILPIMHGGLPVQLVRCDVKVAIVGQAHGVRPKQARVMKDRPDLAIGRDLLDGIGFVIARVHISGSV
jgi:hypothetical protein